MTNQIEYGYDDAMQTADMIMEKVEDHGMASDEIKDGVILGSGLGGFADEHLESSDSAVEIPYNNIYETLGRPVSNSRVPGHAKKIIISPLKDSGSERLVMALSGREHPYEGISGQRATFLLRVMQVLGVKTLFGSNASGVITPKTLSIPSLMLNNSNQDLAIAVDNPLYGPNDDRLGPRFPHMSDLYPRNTQIIAEEAAMDLQIPLAKGMYIRFQGPNYESPEDISRAVNLVENAWERGKNRHGEHRFQGEPVGVVGMSSTYEARVAQHASQSETYPAFLDGRAFISVATNYAASIGPNGYVEPCSHEEVQENAEIIQEQFGRLAREIILRTRKES